MSQENTRGRNRANRRNFNRGRSQSRGGRPNVPAPLDYTKDEQLSVVTQQQHQLKARLEQNEQLAKAAESKPRNPNIDKIIEEGKQITSKFFRGFNPTERGNIKVTLDSSFVNRVAEPYYDKLDHVVRDLHTGITDPTEIQTMVEKYSSEFAGALDFATAIKLYKSATAEKQDRMFYWNSVQKSSVSIPKKASVIINQLGKTDLKDDNKIRIVGQDMTMKRHLVRAVVRSGGKTMVEPYMKGKYYDDLKDKITSYENIDGMIDDTTSSVEYVQSMIQQKFDEVRAQAHTIADVKGNLCTISFPPFNFENATAQSLKAYASNELFKNFAFDKANDFYKVVAMTTLSMLDVRWLRDRTKTVGDALDADKTGTDFDKIVINDLFTWLGFWFINDYFAERDLNELASTLIHQWNVGTAQRLRSYFKMEELQFSEYGSDSQTVELFPFAITRNNKTFKEFERRKNGVSLNYIKGKAKSWVRNKISESGAIFGTIVKFNKKVEYTSNFEISFEGDNRTILREFLKSDMLI